MGVMLQGFFQDNGSGVPSPHNGDVGVDSWWNHLAAQANDLRRAGFTAVWLPPVTKGASGTQSIGYDLFDDYDLGSKNQQGSISTRYGTREELQRCAAVLRANDLDIYIDIVDHQRDGETDGPFKFRYTGANNVPHTGRFPKVPGYFRPNVPVDPNVIDQTITDGRNLAPINAKPKGELSRLLIEAADWTSRALDVQGYRFDEAKGMSPDFAFSLFTSKTMAGKFVVGEFFDGIEQRLHSWVFDGMRGIASAFDFPLRFMLADMCNQPGRFNMALLDDAGFTAIAPFNSVTFVENHDTDPKSPVVSNKLLAYTYILTTEGYPSVYYRDYSTDRNCFGLKPQIDNLIWIHEHLAQGGTLQRWKDHDVFAYERLGGPRLLTALNNNPFTSRTISVDTGFGPHTPLHDYSGHAGDVTTDGNGRVTIVIPPNVSGQSYVCYSRSGITGDFEVSEKATSQEFEGGVDLDIPPATPNFSTVAKLWARAGSQVHLKLSSLVSLPAGASATIEIDAPAGGLLGSKTYTHTTPASEALTVPVAAAQGFHEVRIKTTGIPELPFVLVATYTARQKI